MAGALVVMSVAHLFALRFESGDVYPAYSTLRADPLGARAYFEALERLPGLTVERNLRPLPRLRLDEPATLFVLGMDRWAFDNVDEREAREAEHLASLGGRVVVAFAPSYGVIGGGPAFGRRFAPPPQPTPVSPFAPPAPQDSATSSPLELIAASVANKTTSATATAMSTPAGGKNISEDAPDFMAGKIVSLGERWGVKLIHAPFPTDKDGRAGWVEARRSHDAPHDLPAMLHWHSAIAFAPDDERWRPIYARGETPVAMERPWGRGTIVLISDSYYFSNEAARQDRQPEWLAWAAGSPARLIFNETQHGLLQEPGIMGLAREYRLEGALISLLALALLFVCGTHRALSRAERVTRRESAAERNRRQGRASRTCCGGTFRREKF